MGDKKPHCMVCKNKPAKLMKSTHYKYAADFPVFCSQRCATQYALLAAAMELHPSYFCPVAREWTTLPEGEYCAACIDCDTRCDYA